ncbi:zeta tubulin [Novymonas esmeraldas]|uniref:Zeta tubulin n=1 Tax=Novymonas esmeraldas TaxID=1808958 RepID=A0AAW0F7G6_9TRYP
MAVVVVLVGQCGNQLGDELFTQLRLCAAANSPAAAGADASVATPFFTRDGKARCVLVDTEPKVVRGVQQRHSDFIRPENVIHGQSGRGNNWGLGYYGMRTEHSRRTERNAAVQRAFRNMGRDQREEDDNVLGKALQAIYRETRRTSDLESGEGFEALLVLHSLVGGTGSGLASRLTERLRLYFTAPPPGEQVDEVYESKMMRLDGIDGGLYGAQRRAQHLVNVTVAPQALGEVATQGLNTALTLQVLQRHADAILLLRNDDAMAPGEATASGVSGGASLVSRCTTFKEANEILVALLLPLLRYGRYSGCVTRLLRQCIPPTYQRTTGGNKILTLLAAPQRSYATLRQSVHRAMFFIVHGGRTFMPGYVPTVPVDEMLSRTALRLAQGGGGGGGSSRAGVRGGGDRREAQLRLSHHQQSPSGRRQGVPAPRGGGISAGAAAAAAAAAASAGRRQPAAPLSTSSLRPRLGTSFDGAEDEEGGGGDELAELDKRVYLECGTRMPAALYQHYLQLRRAPVTKLAEALDGVLVLNQALELNRRLLFPLLRSAALKVSTGAFMSSYEDVGVKAERVQRAYREVAEVLANAEEL